MWGGPKKPNSIRKFGNPANMSKNERGESEEKQEKVEILKRNQGYQENSKRRKIKIEE